MTTGAPRYAAGDGVLDELVLWHLWLRDHAIDDFRLRGDLRLQLDRVAIEGFKNPVHDLLNEEVEEGLRSGVRGKCCERQSRRGCECRLLAGGVDAFAFPQARMLGPRAPVRSGGACGGLFHTDEVEKKRRRCPRSCPLGRSRPLGRLGATMYADNAHDYSCRMHR